MKLVLDDAYLEAVIPLIESAKKSIDILAYSFAIGSMNGALTVKGAPFKIAMKLAEVRERKKLKIRLYIEGSRDTSERNRVTAGYLAKHGIKVKYGATHAKGFCFDQQRLLFGSTNLTNQSMTKNRETNLLIQNSSVAKEFTRYFNNKWEGGEHGDISLKTPLLADGDFKVKLLEMIDGAKKTLGFSIYFFHITEIENALKRAHDRGVCITGVFGRHQSFARSYVQRTRGTAVRLSRYGILDLHYGSPNTFTHSKFLVKDGTELLLGTGNWLHEDVQVHPQLYIHLNSKPLSRTLSEYLKVQIKKENRPVARA